MFASSRDVEIEDIDFLYNNRREKELTNIMGAEILNASRAAGVRDRYVSLARAICLNKPSSNNNNSNNSNNPEEASSLSLNNQMSLNSGKPKAARKPKVKF